MLANRQADGYILCRLSRENHNGSEISFSPSICPCLAADSIQTHTAKNVNLLKWGSINIKDTQELCSKFTTLIQWSSTNYTVPLLKKFFFKFPWFSVSNLVLKIILPSTF